MVLLEQRGLYVILPVRAQPGARRNGITGVHAGELKVAVTQAPEKGKANQALIEVLATFLSLKRSQISLISGETAGHKKFQISEISINDLQQKIDSVLKL